MIEVYLEGGPLEGQTHVVEEARPILIWMMPDMQRDLPAYVSFGQMEDFKINTLRVEYHRELAPHRSQVVCYFHDPLERDRAYLEDTMEFESDVQTGMLESCQPLRITPAYMPPLSVLRSSASLDAV